MLANFNDSTAYNTFPPLSITSEEAQAKSSPVVGDPGFIVEFSEGTWSWAPNLETAKLSAGEVGAIYQSWEVCDYFKQFAREESLNSNGTETDEGPLA